jgi:hypothetical protein
VLALGPLPVALKAGDPAPGHDFEQLYESLAKPALLGLVITVPWWVWRRVHTCA